MTIEVASTINQLNTAYPREADLIKEGDNHIRLIKSTLKTTFPAINKTVNVSSDYLNYLNTNIAAGSTSITFRQTVYFTSGVGSLQMAGRQIKNVGNATENQDVVSLAQVRTEIANAIANQAGATRQVFRDMFPVGALWISNNGTNPNTLKFFNGTTWVAHFPGRALVSYGNGTSDAALNIGLAGKVGASTITLGVANIPSHNHSIPSISLTGSGTASSAGNHYHISGSTVDQGVINGGTWSGTYGFTRKTGGPYQHISSYGGNGYWGWNTSTAGAHTHPVSISGSTSTSTTGATGSTAAFSLAQPSIGIAVWRRTA